MFKLDPTHRQKNKYFGKQNDAITIPDRWVDFARMLTIRSAGSLVKFEPYPFQEKLVELMIERSCVLIKSRQCGLSEVLVSFLLWRAAKSEGYLGVVFSKNQKDSSLLAYRMLRMIGSVGLKLEIENLTHLKIRGGGTILFRNSQPDSARGLESVVDCFLDECSFLDNSTEIYNALAPTMTLSGDKARIYLVSTPNSKKENDLYWSFVSSGNGDIDVESLCSQVSQGQSEPFQWWVDSAGFYKIIVHWKCHPVYGSKSDFLQEIHEKQKLSWETIEQEYNLNFQTAESLFFDYQIVKQCVKPVDLTFNKDCFHFIGIDPSFSTKGEDYCCVIVVRLNKDVLECVELYRKRKESNSYHLFQISKLIEKYEPSVVNIEKNSGGIVWLEELEKSFRYTKITGTHTTNETKIGYLERLKMMLESEKVAIPDNPNFNPIVSELLNFRKLENGKLSSPANMHDDCVIGLALTVSAMLAWQ